MAKKFLFTISHTTTRPLEPVGILKIASNIKAFEDDADVVIFLLGEGVQLAKKGVASTISMELEGAQVNVGDLLEMAIDTGIKLYVCHAFMPAFGVGKDDLIEGAESKGSSYLGELLLADYVPFTLSI